MELVKKEPVIFIVSGKANSGKDTSCDLINNYVRIKNKNSINLQFSSYIKTYAKKISGWDGSEKEKPRTLLQQLGTDIIRDKIDNNFFINRIIGDIKVYSYYFDFITISDARFPEEIDSIYKEFKNVYRLRIERPGFVNNLDNNEKKHISEIALDDYNNYDYVVINDSSLEELNNKLRNIVDEVI